MLVGHVFSLHSMFSFHKSANYNYHQVGVASTLQHYD